MDVKLPCMPNKSRQMFVITEETLLIELLSSSEVPGRLYSMIASIVSIYVIIRKRTELNIKITG